VNLVLRFVRALGTLAVILSSYLFQIALARIFSERDEGRRVVVGWVARRKPAIDQKNAKRLLREMLRLRGVYIKLGQVLSIMGGFLPRAYGTELQVLQDQVPPQPFAAFERRVLESFGKPWTELFARVDREPIAAASLGQVHTAWLADGRKVAVKILYPQIRETIRTDMKIVRLAVEIYRRFVPVQNIESVHDALVDLLDRETDYLHEADCMEAMAANFASRKDLAFPEVVRELTTRDVLTMTFMEGFKITDVERMKTLGIDPSDIARRLVEWFYESMFVHRLFHADPHPGNFLVEIGEEGSKPRIVVLDFGAVSEVGESMIEGMIDVLQGFFERRDALVLKGFEHIGFVADEANRELVERTVLTYFRKLLKVKDRTAGALMRASRSDLEALADPELERQSLRELMRSIRYPDGWFYVERASVLAFWLVGQIAPDVDTLQVGFPYVLPLLADRAKKNVAPRK
jgi:ubiquinone biosynthesis protein